MGLWSTIHVLLSQHCMTSTLQSHVIQESCAIAKMTGRTDGRTDRRTTCNRKTTLCTKVHCVAKTRTNIKNLS